MGGGIKSSTIDINISDAQEHQIDTGLTSIKRIIMSCAVGSATPTGNMTLTMYDADAPTNTKQLTCGGSSTSVSQSVLGAPYPSNQNYAPVIKNISGGVVTVQAGNTGGWIQLIGKLYAYAD